jgi:F0F1-type ATP synthase delta subunit
MLSKSKKNRIVNKINKSFNLLLKFLILFENKTTFYCFYNIIAKFKLALTKFKNLLITLTIFDYLKRNKNRQILLFC